MRSRVDEGVGLNGEAFDAFFQAVHGVAPFPWQSRLARQVLAEGRWPDQLDLPTASGKTAVLDIALFHLAAEAHREIDRRAPVRIAFVVDRRLIVDDAYARAARISQALAESTAQTDGTAGPKVVFAVRAALLRLAENPATGEARPLLVRRLRGGVPREDDWARTPSQPTILTSTVDQVGSRLLYRGYGLRPTMAPIHAGLLGSDCLIVLDEAHLSRAFEQTLEAIAELGEGRIAAARPLQTTVMTATPARPAKRPFALDHLDRQNPTLAARLTRAKPTALVLIKGGKSTDDDEGDSGAELKRPQPIDRERVQTLADQVETAISALRREESGLGAGQPVIGVVVNRVLRARQVYDELVRRVAENAAPGSPDAPLVTLVIGPARAVDRERLADRQLAPLKSDAGAARASLTGPRIVVATQTIEVGVDLDFDALVTEIAAFDALRQRFGRLNRTGRHISPYAAIVAHPKDDLKLKGEGDPLYGHAAKATWEQLTAWLGDGGLDFASEALNARWDALDPEQRVAMLAPPADAPVLMPAHVALWAQTSPVPLCDPEVALYLHGPARNAPKVRLVWRADFTRASLPNAAAVLEAAPPQSAEAVEVSLAAARAWMTGLTSGRQRSIDFSDAPQADEVETTSLAASWSLYRHGAREGLVRRATDLRPDDLLIVPAEYGGCDAFGWRPDDRDFVEDLAERAAWPFRARRYAARLTESRWLSAVLPAASAMDDIARDVLTKATGARWTRLAARLAELAGDAEAQLEAVLNAELPPELRAIFTPLVQAKRNRSPRRLDVLTPYAPDDATDPYAWGVVISARFGLGAGAKLIDGGESSEAAVAGGLPCTEDDQIGSMARREVTLTTHARDVERQVAEFARTCGLAEPLVRDLALAGWLHDAGKVDPRFQAMLGTGDPLFLEETAVLAKSGRRGRPGDGARAGLPAHWRHEALSVRLALNNSKLEEADDPALVLWLVGVHHGWGRPFFPHADPRDLSGHPELPTIEGLSKTLGAGAGPQSLSFALDASLFKSHADADIASSEAMIGLDWAQMFDMLRLRYGPWGLAHLEALLRLADHRASERRDLAPPDDVEAV